jgi:hypothetical protein
MPTRELVLCITLSGPTSAAVAQTVPTPENWTAVGRMATTITGRVTFTPTEMTFQNAKSLSLIRDGQMLFRPEAKKKKVIADVYKVTPPDDPALESGNKLCKGKPIAYLLVWKSEKTGTETDPRTLAPFSGQKLNSGSPDDCGRYTYDAGPP